LTSPKGIGLILDKMFLPSRPSSGQPLTSTLISFSFFQSISKTKTAIPTSLRLDKTFSEYFACLNALDNNTPTQFEKIENLIDLHFTFVDEFPDETYLITSACPAKLRDSEHICTRNIEVQRQLLTNYISDCLKKGIETGEFDSISTEATSGLIIAMVNSLLRRKKLKLDGIQGLKEITVEFFRRSLVKN
jgi:hypothetical protein